MSLIKAEGSRVILPVPADKLADVASVLVEHGAEGAKAVGRILRANQGTTKPQLEVAMPYTTAGDVGEALETHGTSEWQKSLGTAILETKTGGN